MSKFFPECVKCDFNHNDDEGQVCYCDEGQEPDFCTFSTKNTHYKVSMTLPAPDTKYSNN
jgi:hypothetical protein